MNVSIRVLGLRLSLHLLRCKRGLELPDDGLVSSLLQLLTLDLSVRFSPIEQCFFIEVPQPADVVGKVLLHATQLYDPRVSEHLISPLLSVGRPLE